MAQYATCDARDSGYELRALPAAITSDLSKLPGVSAVSASPETKLVEVEFDPGQLTIEMIKGALSKAGYPAQDAPA